MVIMMVYKLGGGSYGQKYQRRSWFCKIYLVWKRGNSKAILIKTCIKNFRGLEEEL